MLRLHLLATLAFFSATALACGSTPSTGGPATTASATRMCPRVDCQQSATTPETTSGPAPEAVSRTRQNLSHVTTMQTMRPIEPRSPPPVAGPRPGTPRAH